MTDREVIGCANNTSATALRASLCMAAAALPESVQLDLLVVLGVQRFGTDWPNVATAVKAALGPLEGAPAEPPPASECEERFRALVEGVPAELTALAGRLQAKRLEHLAQARAAAVERVRSLCSKLPPGHPARPSVLSAASDTGKGGGDGDMDMSSAADGAEDADGASSADGKRSSGRTRVGGGEAAPDTELEDNWAAIAEEEEKNSRRATVAGTLNKMLQAVAKHKWAYPFKRPVTDKEAPDYKEIITNAMDFTTLKRRVESGQVGDVDALVIDLNLIFDNAMVYNGKGTDYYRMASTLKECVRLQQQSYAAWRREHGGTLGTKSGGGSAGSVPQAAVASGADEVVPVAASATPATGEDDAEMVDADPNAPSEAAAGGRLRRGRRAARS